MEFTDVIAQWGVTLTPAQLQMYARYLDLLLLWNERFNLTAITRPEEVYLKHFADSLAGLPFVRGRVCDVGAGAGLPSLALAIADADSTFTLLDSVAKKVTFLDEVIRTLPLPHARAGHVRAEDAGPGPMRQTFDTVLARAVAPLPTLLEYLCPLAKVGGRVVVYKTNAEDELALAAHAIEVLGLRLADTLTYTIMGAARCILVFDKPVATPRQYPRGGNKPRTMPL